MDYVEQVAQFCVKVRVGGQLVEDDVVDAFDGESPVKVEPLRVEQQPPLADEEPVTNLSQLTIRGVLASLNQQNFKYLKNQVFFKGPAQTDLSKLDLLLVQVIPQAHIVVVGRYVNERIGHEGVAVLRQDPAREELEPILSIGCGCSRGQPVEGLRKLHHNPAHGSAGHGVLLADFAGKVCAVESV